MTEHSTTRVRRRLRLPVVRVRPLPDERSPRWQEGPDWPAVVAVAAVGVLGAALALATVFAELGASAPRTPVIAGAALLVLACVAAALLAVAEAMHREHVAFDGDVLEVTRRGLTGRARWREPLQAYQGLALVDRRRRLFVRNQDRPPTGRRGPVTEFVVVLRHREDPARDLELFRAQPSLETLRTMHAMNVTRAARGAGGGSAGAAAAACEERARDYRDAVRRLARALRVQVLVAAGEGAVPRAVDADRLDDWLAPDDGETEGGLKA